MHPFVIPFVLDRSFPFKKLKENVVCFSFIAFFSKKKKSKEEGTERKKNEINNKFYFFFSKKKKNKKKKKFYFFFKKKKKNASCLSFSLVLSLSLLFTRDRDTTPLRSSRSASREKRTSPCTSPPPGTKPEGTKSLG